MGWFIFQLLILVVNLTIGIFELKDPQPITISSAGSWFIAGLMIPIVLIQASIVFG